MCKVAELVQKLRSILEEEIQALEDGIMQDRALNDEAMGRLLSRLSKRNDIIRINTLKWVLEEIEKARE